MGKSQPPRAVVDLVNSYARRVDEAVEVVLHQPDPTLPADATVELRRGKRRATAQSRLVDDERGRRMVLRMPLDQLGDGVWRLRVRTPDGMVRLGCRLLLQGPRPPVLLWGAETPRSALPRPRVSATNPSPARRGPAGLARALAGRVRRAVSRRARRPA